MKIFFNRLTILVFLLIIATFVACEKGISEEPVGIENVYIPQSISASTTDNNYAVPGNVNFGPAKNFEIDEANNKVIVYLGVAKSGKAPTQPFTVQVTSRADTINELIADGENFLLLPSTAYTLPTSVSLTAGQSVASFNMVIDKTTLQTFVDEKVAVCVTLSNPTEYMLNAKTRNVIVIIDVNALNLE